MMGNTGRSRKCRLTGGVLVYRPVCNKIGMQTAAIGNESVPLQLAQCRFPGLAISNAEILIYFSNKIYGSNFIKQHLETVMV